MIKPTRGRVVLFTPSEADNLMAGGEPLAAIIAHVHSDSVLNLTVFDGFGRVHARPSVTLIQEGEVTVPGSAFAEWMPYQKGQAAKTEQVEKALEACVPKPSGNRLISKNELEREIQAAKADVAPRVTPADIDATVVSEHYFTALQGARMSGLDAVNEGDGATLPYIAPHEPSLGLLTFCVLVLRNGFTVTGESACASPENFNAGIGKKVARQNAMQKIWPLEGYLLKERLFQMQQPSQAPE